jgi:putative transposase
VERAAGELPLSLQADLLSLSRSSLYYQPRPPSAAEVRLKHRIDEVYTQCPFYGARKIAAQLQCEGLLINRKTVARYMREMGIAAIYPGPNLSKRNQKEGVYPYSTRVTLRVLTPIISGGSTSPTFACMQAGCTW